MDPLCFVCMLVVILIKFDKWSVVLICNEWKRQTFIYVISCDKMRSWEYEGVEQVDDDLTLQTCSDTYSW